MSSPASELKVRDALTQLDDRWRIFHSIAWQSERYGRQGDGEADFVLLHPENGLIVLEVKGGERIEVDGGRWYSINSRSHERIPIKNPFDQAKDSKYALIRYLQGLSSTLGSVPIIHGVVFPGANVTSDIAPYAPRSLIIDASDLNDTAGAIRRLVGHWEINANISKPGIEEITGKLAPTVTIRRRLENVVSETSARLLELTEQQSRAFRITRLHRRAAIRGGPGTGKTVLALERALQLADDGFRVLLTCFNRPLADQLAQAVDGAVVVSTFHSLCLSQAATADMAVAPDAPGWWQEGAPNTLVDAAETLQTTFDAIIVDEGQDFASDWLWALQRLLSDKDNGVFYLFYDPRQALMQPNWVLPPNLNSFPLDWNCRSTLSIASKVSVVYGDETLAIGASGAEPRWITADSTESGLRTVQELVDCFLAEEGLTPEQLVVLADSRQAVDRLHRMVVSDVSFANIGGDGVVAETVHRFKGLEADVVILLLSTGSNNTDEICGLAYVGMSRARTFLVVVGPESVRKTVNWDSAISSEPRSIRPTQSQQKPDSQMAYRERLDGESY